MHNMKMTRVPCKRNKLSSFLLFVLVFILLKCFIDFEVQMLSVKIIGRVKC